MTFLQSALGVAQTLRPSANGRYVEWSDGTPVFLLSDTAWLLPGRYSTSEVETYLEARKAQGFTAVQMTACFPENKYQDIHAIFTEGDLARPVGPYWSAVDAKVKQVTDAGLIVIINPFWKKTSDAWLAANGPAKCRAYGKWFATRYRDNPRVAYFVGGDSPPESIRAEMDEMGQGIQDAYREAGLPAALVAYHGKPGQSSRDSYPSASWVTLNWIYRYGPPFAKKANSTPVESTWSDWRKTPAMPMMLGEGFYDRGDASYSGSRFGDRYMCRRQAWWAVLAGGIGGYAYGAEPVWFHGYKGQTWQHGVAYESGADAARLLRFLAAREWWKLQPDLTQVFLTGGQGTQGTADFACAAVAEDQSFAMVYTPEARALTLRMPTATRGYTLRWFDPRNGVLSGQTETTAAAPGTSVTMTPPGPNAQGKADWVLLATLDPAPEPPPSSSVSSASSKFAPRRKK